MIFRLLASLLLACGLAHAETVSWSLGQTIDLAVPISQPDQVQTRTVLLPVAAVAGQQQFHSEEDLDVTWEKNAVFFRLKNPGFNGRVHIFDRNNNLFIFQVHAAAKGDSVDAMLVLRQEGQVGTDAARRLRLNDQHRAMATMAKAMLRGRDETGGSIVGTLVTTIVDGKVQPGRIIYQDDYVTMSLLQAWRGPTVRGFHVVCRVVAERPVRLDYQRLWFPGAIAVSCPQAVVLDDGRTAIDGEPGKIFDLYFIAE